MTPAPAAMQRRTLVAVVLGAAAVLLAAGVLLVGGSGAGNGPDPAVGAGHAAHSGSTTSTTTSSDGRPAKVLTVEQLAATVGCQAKIDLKAADYRQASCTAAGVQIVLLDFDTADGQRAWLDYAVMYGGVYLVGNRWALSGNSREYMETLRATLGGTIEETGTH